MVCLCLSRALLFALIVHLQSRTSIQWVRCSSLLKVGSTTPGGGGGGGWRAKRVCVPEMGFSLLALCSKCHFPLKEHCG